jgi:hypothetical protein
VQPSDTAASGVSVSSISILIALRGAK